MTSKTNIKKKNNKQKQTPKQVEKRMAKLRAKKKPAEYKNIHPSVLAKPDDDVLSFKNVREWIKYNKEMISAYNKQSKIREIISKEKRSAVTKSYNKQGYVNQMEHYLRRGDWISDFYGKDENTKIQWKCVSMAFYPDGTPKRTVGVFYADLQMVWTKNMDESDFAHLHDTNSFKTKNLEIFASTDKPFIRE